MTRPERRNRAIDERRKSEDEVLRPRIGAVSTPPTSEQRLVLKPPPLPGPAVSREPTVPPPLPVVPELREGALVSDQYLVERVVGGMGACVVVKVRHARLGQRCYLKYLTAQAANELGATKRFLAGARAAMKLRSEHTARTLDAGRLSSGLPYVVTESFQGSELREVMRVRGALTVPEAIVFVLQAAEAVAEAHHHGLVHGSLSPSTLFLTRGSDGRPTVKVLDFGSAHTLRSDPFALKIRTWHRGTALFWESSRLWDTLAYTAPEQLREMGEPTPRSDVWALGATLYELLSGAPPFSEKTATSLMAAVVADAPAPLSTLNGDVPRKLEEVVLQCLAKEPSERVPSVADLAAALSAFAPAETRLEVDRILRIQSRDEREGPLSGSSHPSVRSIPPRAGSFVPASAGREASAGHRALRLFGSVLLVASGVVAGTLGGTFLARHALSLVEPPRPVPSAAPAVAPVSAKTAGLP